MFHAGLSIETFLPCGEHGLYKQELDRIRNEMNDKVTAAISRPNLLVKRPIMPSSILLKCWLQRLMLTPW